MSNDELILLGGIFCLTISFLLGSREIKNWNSTEKDDYMTKSFSIKKFGGIFIFFMIGIVIIYRYFSDLF
tara:strand:+ start:599 stop:808 length:210 start_codon:yes stop_codon:yes gene_type:complete